MLISVEDVRVAEHKHVDTKLALDNRQRLLISYTGE